MFGRKRAPWAISPTQAKGTCEHFFPLRFGLQPSFFWQTQTTRCNTVFSEGNIILLSCFHVILLLLSNGFSRPTVRSALTHSRSGKRPDFASVTVERLFHCQIQSVCPRLTCSSSTCVHVHASEHIYRTLLVPAMFLARCHTCKIRPRFPLAGDSKHPKLPFAILGCCFYLFVGSGYALLRWEQQNNEAVL